MRRRRSTRRPIWATSGSRSVASSSSGGHASRPRSSRWTARRAPPWAREWRSDRTRVAAAPGRGARRTVGGDRPWPGSAGRAHAPVVGHRVRAGGATRPQPGAEGHGLLHDAAHVDRLSRGLAGVRALVRRRHLGPPRRVPRRLGRVAVPAVPARQRRPRRAAGSAGARHGHADARRPRPARNADPLPLHLGGRPGPAHGTRPGGRRNAGLHVRAVRRRRPPCRCVRRGHPDRDAGGPAGRRGRGAPADVRRPGSGRDGQESARRSPRPDRRRRLHVRCRGALPGCRGRPVGPGAVDRPRLRDPAGRTPARRPADRHRRLRRPQVPVHARALPQRGRARRGGRRTARYSRPAT